MQQVTDGSATARKGKEGDGVILIDSNRPLAITPPEQDGIIRPPQTINPTVLESVQSTPYLSVVTLTDARLADLGIPTLPAGFLEEHPEIAAERSVAGDQIVVPAVGVHDERLGMSFLYVLNRGFSLSESGMGRLEYDALWDAEITLRDVGVAEDEGNHDHRRYLIAGIPTAVEIAEAARVYRETHGGKSLTDALPKGGFPEPEADDEVGVITSSGTADGSHVLTFSDSGGRPRFMVLDLENPSDQALLFNQFVIPFFRPVSTPAPVA